jgi:peptidoglycan/xylan/chitin deacetylase (PgdA/CDA1 family)
MGILRAFALPAVLLVASACVDVVGPRSRPLVSLVFDDNALGVAEYAFPRMSGRGMVGTVFVHTCSIGRPSYMGIDELRMLRRAGWEIGAHTVSHPDLTCLTPEEVTAEAVASRARLEALGFQCRSFAVPYGLVNEAVRDVLGPLFEVVRDSRDRCLRRPIDWHLIGMYALHAGETPRSAMGRMDRAVRRSEDLVVLGFHGVTAAGGDYGVSYPCYDVSDLEAILSYIERLGLTTTTLDGARQALR